ncbi:MAG: formate/nitrite transporter family protein [Helcococcus sp.]|nr:formate/nitrite transporter family protein [Helcococcus sp.]
MNKSLFVEKIEYNCNKKSNLINESFSRYALRSIFAGVFLTFSTLAGVLAADNLNLINNILGKFAFAFLFSFGLVYILFLNSELATSNMMYLSAGAYLKKIKIIEVIKILIVCTLFNLLGALISSFLIGQSGVLHTINVNSILFSIVQGKLSHSSFEIFNGAILANIFVNIAIISYLLMDDSHAKITVILSAVFMFVYIGLDHVIANFASFSLVLVSGKTHLANGFDVLNILRQWSFAFIGNFIGGAIMGITYAYFNDKERIYHD